MYGGLFTQEELDREITAGYVHSKVHPEDDELWILNYTKMTAYDGHWNNVTLNCRGLIVDAFGNIIARPLPKFFNYGQPDCPVIDINELVYVSDKMDGSLGIMYRVPGDRFADQRIATRGSFTSEQAIHATEILRTKYAGFVPPKGITLLFEIIYPENRVVCDYGDMDDLVLLGSVDNSNGDNWDACAVDWDWPGPKAEVFDYWTTREALQAAPRPGKEGFVVHLLRSDIRVKIKQEDYIRLHRIVTGLNARTVWQAMVDGTVDELIAKVPDEFDDFVRSVQEAIEMQVKETFIEVLKEYVAIGFGPEDRKAFAAKVVKSKYFREIFMLADREPRLIQYILEKSKPAHNFSPVKVSNDAD